MKRLSAWLTGQFEKRRLMLSAVAVGFLFGYRWFVLAWFLIELVIRGMDEWEKTA